MLCYCFRLPFQQLAWCRSFPTECSHLLRVSPSLSCLPYCDSPFCRTWSSWHKTYLQMNVGYPFPQVSSQLFQKRVFMIGDTGFYGPVVFFLLAGQECGRNHWRKESTGPCQWLFLILSLSAPDSRWNRKVLCLHWNVGSEVEAMIINGRMFHALSMATGKARSPISTLDVCKATKPGFIFSCLFCFVAFFWFIVFVFFRFIGCSFFSTTLRDWLGRTSLKWTIFVLSVLVN